MNKFLPIIMSGILALPTLAFAASSVRTLGGAGTYNGVTSVGAGTATRAGSIRAVPSVKVSKTTTSATTTPSTSGSTGTVSGNTGAGTRMSMGKYLSGLGAAATKVSTSTATTGVEEDIDALAGDLAGLSSSLSDLAEQVAMLEQAGYITKADLSDDNLSEDYLTKNEIEALLYIDETELEKALTELKLEEYAKKDDIPTSANIANIIASAVESGDLELSGYAKTSELSNYAEKSTLEIYATTDEVAGQLDALSISAGEWIDTAVDAAKEALDARIDSVEAGIPSFSVYPGAFDPDNLD